MAKRTFVTVHQDLGLEKKGIEINVWEGRVKGGRLQVNRSKVAWFPPKAKKPSWSGTWEEFALLFKTHDVKCDRCQATNHVAKVERKKKCDQCGKTFKVEW